MRTASTIAALVLLGCSALPAQGPDDSWQWWWHLHGHRYVRLREAVHEGGIVTGDHDFYMGRFIAAKNTLRPTPAQITREIVPVVHRILAEATDRDLTTSCMIALAKIAPDHPSVEVVDAFRVRLEHEDATVRETAALCLGLAQRPEAIPDLIEIAAAVDTERRVRAFAIYGLGLQARVANEWDVQRPILDALVGVLADGETDPPDAHVAAIHAIAMLRSGSKAVLDAACDALEAFDGHPEARFHRYPALAKLLNARHEPKRRARLLDRLTAALDDGEHEAERSSVVVALGQLARPSDQEVCAALLRRLNAEPARTLLALGQIGGTANRDALLSELERDESWTRSWAALALGVLEHQRLRREFVPDPSIGKALRNALRTSTTDLTGAVAIALGLASDSEAVPELRTRLAGARNDELISCLGIALALLDDVDSLDGLTEIVRLPRIHSERLVGATIALGRLGDTRVAPTLTQRLEIATEIRDIAAIASAVAHVGDVRSVDPLLARLRDESLPPLAQAFLVVALGCTADYRLAPWNLELADGMNWRFPSVDTLTDCGRGVLDLM